MLSRRILALLVVIVVVNAVVGFHLIVNYVDWKMVFFNPTITYAVIDNTKSFYCDYPPNPCGVPHIVIYPNGTELGLPLFSLTITYSYNDTLAQGVPFLLYAGGSIYPEGQQTVDRVDVGYHGASFNDSSFRNYLPTFTATLYKSSVYTTQVPPQGIINMLAIKWNSEGDYYPYIHIVFKNGTMPIDFTIQDGKVHVYGLNVIQQEQFNRKQDEYNRRMNAMVLDGILFPLIDISTIVGLFWKGKAEHRNETTPSTTKSDRRHKYDKIQRKKSKSRKKQRKKRKKG